MYQESIDKNLLKSVLEDMLKERNPELQSFLEELLTKFMARTTDKTMSFDMTEIRQKYALKRDAFIPLHDLFKDAPSAYDLANRLTK